MIGVIGLVQSPDRELHFSREIPSRFESVRLGRNLSAISRWPQWFYSLAEVTSSSQSDPLQKGAILTLKMDPKKGKRKQFDLTFVVTDVVPEKSIQLKLIDDSSQRLTHLFDHIEWKIEIESAPNGTRLKGSAVAHTHHWRARLLGGIAERILMNQIFYPNLVRLAELRQPFSAELTPESLGLSGSMTN